MKQFTNKGNTTIQLELKEYENLLGMLKEQAHMNQDERTLIKVAGLYQDMIVTGVTCGDERYLAYEDHYKYVRNVSKIMGKVLELKKIR